MRRGPAPRVDAFSYLQALPLFVRHFSVIAAPLLAAVVALILLYFGQTMTDPMGGMGSGLYTMIAQLAYMLALGIAIVQASNVWRGRKGSFDFAWSEARPKIGNILLAAIGFQFVIYVAGYIGELIPLPGLEIVLTIVAAIFLIYSIPAAAIGGLPGGAALSASIHAVRANPLAAIVLGVVFYIVWTLIPRFVMPAIVPYLPQFAIELVRAALQAILLGYLAFPFAKQYDDVAFRPFW